VLAVAILFWLCAFLLVFAQVGYPLVLVVLMKLLGGSGPEAGRGERAAGLAGPAAQPDDLGFASIIVPAYAEATTIAARVANLKALDYPPGFEVIISVDGSPDATAANARAAGADIVLERPREGKVRAQDAAVAASRGEVLAFGDANSVWEPDALQALALALARPRVGYVCGDVRFVNEGGTNQEGLYWRYEMALRRLESGLRSVTAGNGAIYATRRDTYLHVDDVMGHDLSFPFNMVKRGYRAIYEPAARATEKMVPSLEGEFARKRRFMGHTWPILIRGGLLSPFGYDPLYAFMVFCHRALRYGSPGLHLLALLANLGLVVASAGWVYDVTLGGQLALLAAAAGAGVLPSRLTLVARYYVLTTASIAAGLWDWLTRRTAPGWEPVQEIR
jgi:cellulose synthase/poly-beta-1,6-N-acetylglucosamine synthase-like glycosyltransferase